MNFHLNYYDNEMNMVGKTPLLQHSMMFSMDFFGIYRRFLDVDPEKSSCEKLWLPGCRKALP